MKTNKLMGVQKKRCWMFFLIGAILFSTGNVLAASITIAADEWPPYNNAKESLTTGYAIEIVTRIFESEGYSVEYIVLPWTRAIRETREGKYDAIVGAYKENAPDFIYPEEEIGISRNVFFVRKDSKWRFNGTDSLNTVMTGLIKDYNYGKSVDAFFRKHPERAHYCYGEKALSTLIRCLDTGIVGAAVEDENVFLYKSKALALSDRFIKAGFSADSEFEVYIAFSPKKSSSNEYAELFSKGIRKLKKSGELTSILEKYGLNYWK